MTTQILPYVSDKNGCYTFNSKATPAEIIDLASSILEERMLKGDALTSSEDTKKYLTIHLGTLEREEFCCLFMDNRHRVIAIETLFTGTINGAAVYPREVVKRSLALNAAAVIFAHNHPSGIPEPSQADESLTQRLKEALAMVEIRVLDHIVVGGADTVSFAERGLI